ncbi:hypothetical protein SAMN02745206_03349 [Desulfacinum infernum DSM 9756]|uniref:Uncharacterized protein n=1 Tax=Desulfacinum infernum DSM 9756 TaxID=1121391 RepID=A0A1M5HFZ7_9BACT|nr:hypothetical protein [Desulfacinum infernum]MBC7358453.1 hypothetical protein [Desulfacinum sp.]SHG14886.1 hypothetical protein SAMN02745206_03349 [Desulfacinum infernum DSM 9756]
MKKALLALVLVFAGWVQPVPAEEPENYCHDPAAEAQWQALVAKHPKDYDLQALHALRIGLCLKVDQGVLTVPEATAIFERARKALIQQRSTPEENSQPSL